jgi:hypothetical protein
MSAVAVNCKKKILYCSYYISSKCSGDWCCTISALKKESKMLVTYNRLAFIVKFPLYKLMIPSVCILFENISIVGENNV